MSSGLYWHEYPYREYLPVCQQSYVEGWKVAQDADLTSEIPRKTPHSKYRGELERLLEQHVNDEWVTDARTARFEAWSEQADVELRVIEGLFEQGAYDSYFEGIAEVIPAFALVGEFYRRYGTDCRVDKVSLSPSCAVAEILVGAGAWSTPRGDYVPIGAVVRDMFEERVEEHPLFVNFEREALEDEWWVRVELPGLPRGRIA